MRYITMCLHTYIAVKVLHWGCGDAGLEKRGCCKVRRRRWGRAGLALLCRRGAPRPARPRPAQRTLRATRRASSASAQSARPSQQTWCQTGAACVACARAHVGGCLQRQQPLPLCPAAWLHQVHAPQNEAAACPLDCLHSPRILPPPPAPPSSRRRTRWFMSVDLPLLWGPMIATTWRG